MSDKVKLIHSVDSFKLGRSNRKRSCQTRIASIDILLEVNVAQESSKFGLKTEEVIPLMEKFSQLPHIRVKGLMTIAPFVENPEENRAIFADLHKLYVDIKQ